MERLPEAGSRWRDIESAAEARVEGMVSDRLSDGSTIMLVRITYTRAGRNSLGAREGNVERVPLVMFMDLWREFVPSMWRRLAGEDEV